MLCMQSACQTVEALPRTHGYSCNFSRPSGDDDDFDALTRANVASFNGAAATVDAHTAHPLRCAAQPFYDCRHFCQPGPVDEWNAQLIRLLLSWNETERTERLN